MIIETPSEGMGRKKEGGGDLIFGEGGGIWINGGKEERKV